MPKVVGVKFRKAPKTYYFLAGEHEFTEGGGVVVETARGVEYGIVTMMPKDITEEEVVSPLKPIIRVATDKDNEQKEKLDARRPEVMVVAAEKIASSNLNMKLVDAEYTFDGAKLILYFTSDNRVDFRDLVRELASTFRVRIELRQIGARDECKLMGGVAPCGRACCCSDHIPEYAHVTIKMAKNQNLSLNPGKISGLCGRLMCCLSYENAYYSEVNKRMPKLGNEVTLKNGDVASVVGINQLKESVTVKIMTKDDTFTFEEVPLSEIKFKGKGSLSDELTTADIPDEVKELLD